VIAFDFNHPTATRLDIERKIRDFNLGIATEQDVKDVINATWVAADSGGC
jgi:hypothetical protein